MVYFPHLCSFRGIHQILWLSLTGGFIAVTVRLRDIQATRDRHKKVVGGSSMLSCDARLMFGFDRQGDVAPNVFLQVREVVSFAQRVWALGSSGSVWSSGFLPSSRLISLEPTDAQKTSKKHKHAERDSCIKWWSQKHTPTKIRKITATWPQMNSQRSTICTKLPVNHHRWGHAPGVWRPSPRRWQLPRGAWKMRQLEAWGDFGGGLATDFHGVSRFTNWVNLGNGKIPRVFEMTNCHYYLFICLK